MAKIVATIILEEENQISESTLLTETFKASGNKVLSEY